MLKNSFIVEFRVSESSLLPLCFVKTGPKSKEMTLAPLLARPFKKQFAKKKQLKLDNDAI